MPGGDPFGAVVAFANARTPPFDLRTGQIVATGTRTMPLPVAHGAHRATFGLLRGLSGGVEVACTDRRRDEAV